MIKTLVTVVITLLIGAIATKTLSPSSSSSAGINSLGNFAENTQALVQIRALEERINEEIEARKLLEKQFNEERTLHQELVQRINELGDTSLVERRLADDLENGVPRLNRSSFGLPNTEEQIENLLNAGFDEGAAERVVALETQMYQSIINARFGGTQTNPRDVILEGQQAIRQELGDDQYELYLETSGRSTTVPVAAIAESSAGALAGLKVGDEIVSYDGDRVFSLLDLQESTQTGTPGQTIIVDVKRGDSTLSLALPRGQIGISTGRAGFGFNRRRTE